MDDETKKQLDEILSALGSLEARVSKLETAGLQAEARGPDGSATEKKISIKEFLIDRAPSNAVQTTLAIAYFLENHEGMSPVNAADIERGFRAAREPVPPNINDKANMCVRNGLLMEAKTKKDNLKAWAITRTGDEMVKKGFGKRTL